MNSRVAWHEQPGSTLSGRSSESLPGGPKGAYRSRWVDEIGGHLGNVGLAEVRVKGCIRIMPVVVILLLLAACSTSSSTQILEGRVASTLTPAIPCNRLASVDPLPNGMQISFPVDALFLAGRTDLTECGHYALASAVEAMLDPRIMQVVVEPDTDITMPDAFLPRERADQVKRIFSDAGFVPAQPPVLVKSVTPQSPRVWRIILAVADHG